MIILCILNLGHLKTRYFYIAVNLIARRENKKPFALNLNVSKL